MKKSIISIFILFLFVSQANSQDTTSITIESVRYPAPVKYFKVRAEGQDLNMAFMDVQPTGTANGSSVILFHGKNFGGYYWGGVINALAGAGYRVVVPDQIGFGKSSKPFLNYSFHQMASWNKMLIDSLGIKKINVLGHSMGGMLATRFALMYPDQVSRLLLENPIGLEDYKTIVPYTGTEKQYATELKSTEESIRAYYKTYFPVWKNEYDWLVKVAAGMTRGAEFPRFAKVAALTFTMIYEQPVVYEFANLKVPTTLFIGTADRTVVGKGMLSKEDQAKYGQYQVLGKQTVQKIAGAKLVEFKGVGHIPHVEVEGEFLKELLAALE